MFASQLNYAPRMSTTFIASSKSSLFLRTGEKVKGGQRLTYLSGLSAASTTLRSGVGDRGEVKGGLAAVAPLTSCIGGHRRRKAVPPNNLL